MSTGNTTLNQGAAPRRDDQLALDLLERRCRSLTGAILGIAAFVASYALMLFEGGTDRPGFHFYPWLLGVLFFLAGDVIAFVWMRIAAVQMRRIVLAEQHRALVAATELLKAESGKSTKETSKDS
jgi:hypothetical protein